MDDRKEGKLAGWKAARADSHHDQTLHLKENALLNDEKAVPRVDSSTQLVLLWVYMLKSVDVAE